MKIRILILILLFHGAAGFGQADIKGKIKDRQQEFLFATVQLLRLDSSLVKTVMTANSGEFVFENVIPGQYIISSSIVGYSHFLSPVISVDRENVLMPDIILEAITTELSSVVVKTKKPLFEQQIDRLVVNVQSNITASGSTVLDVLEKTPGIVVNKQNNTISMNGKSGVRVMINGKIMQLPLDVVLQMLEGMSASNVDKIELITSPPAKYDAEGNAGIIHIILKNSSELGTNGSFGLTYGYRWAEQMGGNFNITHRSTKFAFFVDYSIFRNHNLHIFKMTKRSNSSGFTESSIDYSHRENTTTQQNFNSGLEWKITSKTSLTLSLTGYRSNWDMTATANDNHKAGRDSTVYTTMGIREINTWQSATGGIGLQTKPDTRSELNINLDYLYYHNNNPSGYDINSLFEQQNATEISKTSLAKSTPIKFIIGTIDYQYRCSQNLSLETGIKAVTSRLNNDVLVQHLENNQWFTDPVFTSNSNLDENIEAAYASAKWQVKPDWQINGGIRFEYTHTSIGTPTQKDLINRKYNYFFPSVSIKKDFDRTKDLQFSFSRRITRPTYNDIAPFVFFWAPSTFSAGNTTLLSAISNTVKAGYHVKRWIVSIQFTHSKHEISFLQPELDSLSNLIYRSQNLKYLNTVALTNSKSFSVGTWWEIQTNVVAQYQTAKTLDLPKSISLSSYGININITNSIRLPNDFSFELSGVYQSKMLSGISNYLPSGSLNAGIQKRFGTKGTLRLAIDDVFDTNKWRIKADVPEYNLYSYFNYDFHSRFIRLTFTRNFGNSKLNSVKLKSGSEEERARVTN